MNIAHSVSIRVFCGQEENQEEIINGLKILVPFDFEKEKIELQQQKALGFNDRRIDVFEIVLAKNRHISSFLENMLQKISETDKHLLLRQLDSRVDDKSSFFIRLDKESLAKRSDLLVTDSGNCYHIKIKIAAFPSNKGNAMKVAESFLTAKPKTI